MLPFLSNSNFLLAGMSGSGKTTWLTKLITNKDIMFDIPPKKILYFYGVWQSLFNTLEKQYGIEFHHGLPKDIEDIGEHQLVILDDLQDEVVSCKETEKLFTQGSHHKNLSVIYLTQNLYYQGKCARTISLNSQYIILFQNLRDVNKITVLGKQLGNSKFLKLAYLDAVEQPYSYLLIDLSPHSNPKYRFRTNIFPEDDGIIIYQDMKV